VNDRVKAKLDPVKADIDSKLEEIKKYYSGQIVDTDFVENKLLSPIWLAKTKAQKIKDRLDQIKTCIAMINNLQSDLDKFSQLVQSLQVPDVEKELTPEINQIAALKTEIDNVMKEARDFPNEIIN